jgi:tRNA (cytidine/uridine-2'-O-)-methyltransferase
MLHIALVEPEIAANTGNIARLCAATGTRLHLIGRLGFHLDDRSLRRAGVDYWDQVDLVRHDDWQTFTATWAGGVLWAFTAQHGRTYTRVSYQENDCLVFGCESQGLPPSLLDQHAEQVLTIPMPGHGVRSLNLATAAGIALYEALRQLHRW